MYLVKEVFKRSLKSSCALIFRKYALVDAKNVQENVLLRGERLMRSTEYFICKSFKTGRKVIKNLNIHFLPLIQDGF